MLEYIYFVKCPGCEDEHFFFFNDAKECAMSQLTKKPIITQVEVNRNDFGECTDSADLGTVWSWEEMMAKPDPAAAQSAFSKKDLCCSKADPEFDTLDNSLIGAELTDYDTEHLVENSSGKPVPVDMTVDQLVEEMEENEDTVECKNCRELFDKSECKFDRDYGWLCYPCQVAIEQHGADIVPGQPALEEAFNPDDTEEFEYYDLKVTLQGNLRPNPEYGADWDEGEEIVNHSYYVKKSDVATDIWENFITEEDVKDVEGGLERLEDDREWEEFLKTHFDILLVKYYDKLLDYYRDDAAREYEESHSLGESCAAKETKHFLEELEEPEDYRARLADCPECGSVQSFDHETGVCINCGLML